MMGVDEGVGKVHLDFEEKKAGKKFCC